MNGKGRDDLIDNNKPTKNSGGFENTGKGYFTVDELAQRWRVHRNTILNYTKKGSLIYFKPPGGRIILIPIEEVIQYEQNQIQDRKVNSRFINRNRKVLSAQNSQWRAG